MLEKIQGAAKEITTQNSDTASQTPVEQQDNTTTDNNEAVSNQSAIDNTESAFSANSASNLPDTSSAVQIDNMSAILEDNIYAVLESETAKMDNDNTVFALESNRPGTNPVTDENNEEKSINDIAIEKFEGIIAQYTERTDLSDNEKEQIIAINQLNENLKNTKAQFGNELDTEGIADKIYNGLKDFTGLGITPEIINADIQNEQNIITSLTASINGEIETMQNLAVEKLKRDISIDSLSSSELTDFFGSEEKATEYLNNFLSDNKQDLIKNMDIPDTENCRVVFENGEYAVKSNEEYLPVNLTNILQNNFENIKEELKSYAPTTFEDNYKFYTGQEYNFENIEQYEQDKVLSDIATTGLIAVKEEANQLASSQNANDTYQLFLNQCDGDNKKADTLFNNFYQTVFSAENDNIQASTYLDDGTKMTSIKIQENSNGEREFVCTFDGIGNNMPDNAVCTTDENGNKHWEYTYNLSDDSSENNIVSNVLQDINYNIKKSEFLEEKYENNYKEQYGITPDEAFENLQNSSKESFGISKTQEKLNDYIQDMDSYSSKLSAAISLGSIAGSFINPAIGIGALVGVFTDNAVDAANMATNGVEDNYSELIKNTAKEACFVALGMGINEAAQSIHCLSSNFLQNMGTSLKTAEIAGTGVELLVDGGLSMLTDRITTGDWNINGNSIGLFIDIASGIRGYKAMKAMSDSAEAAIKGIDIPDSNTIAKSTEVTRMCQEGIDEQISEGLIDSKKVQALIDRGFSTQDIFNAINSGYLDNSISDEALALAAKLSDTHTDIPKSQIARCASNITKTGIDNFDITKAKILADDGVLQKDYSDDGKLQQVKYLNKDGNFETVDIDSLAKKRTEAYTKKIEELKADKKDLPEHILTEGEILEATRISSELYSKYLEYSEEASNIVKNIFSDTESVLKYTSRAKSENSVFTKLIKNLENESANINDFESCKNAIKDAFGARIQIKNLTETQNRQIVENYLKRNNLKKYSYEDYKKVIDGLGDDNLNKVFNQNTQTEIMNALKEAHTGEIVRTLVKGIKNGDIVIPNGKFNNYGSAESTYFTPRQLNSIADAYYSVTKTPLEITSTNVEGKYVDGKNGTWTFAKNNKGEFEQIFKSKNKKFELYPQGAQKPGGYTSSQFNIRYRFSDGTEGLGEIQIRGPEVNDYGNIEHGPYDIKSGKYDTKLDSNPIIAYMKKVLTKMDSDSQDEYNSIETKRYETMHRRELGFSPGQIPEHEAIYKSEDDEILDMSYFSYENLLKLFGHH